MLGVARTLFAFVRLIGPDTAANLGGFITRTFGPRLKPHRTAMTNLRAAYPEKAEPELQGIARGAWDSLGRTMMEYPHISKLMDYNHDDPVPNGRVEVSGVDYFADLRDDGKPGIIFSAHLANWELTAICGARHGLDVTAVYRPPNDPVSRQIVEEIRRETMGGLEASRRGAIFALRKVLDEGGHIGMLIDQHFSRGLTVPFLGRPALTNPVLGMLARQYDCPVHGARAVRLPGHRFFLELTPPLDLPRDPDGRVNVEGATAAMTAVVDSWVREHPDQWLWMHRRWRQPTAMARSMGPISIDDDR